MTLFNAYRVHTIENKAVCRFEQLSLEDLDQGEVLIKVSYSAVTYKDAMAARGIGKNVRNDRPCVIGIDLSGKVVNSSDSRFKEGDDVIVTNYKLGNQHDGAYAEYARVPGDWIVPLPKGLNLYEAMCLGTTGLTAALAIERMEKAGLTPAMGPIGITGASGGVGSIAINIFSKNGYEVVAISGKKDQEHYLKAIGASNILSSEEFLENKSPLPPPLFGGALDNVGGIYFDRLAARMQPFGKLAVAGMVLPEINTTALPLVLRAIDILGINVSRQLQMDARSDLWKRLATDLKPKDLDKIARPIPFEKLDEVMDSFFEVKTIGRIVVEIGSKAP